MSTDKTLSCPNILFCSNSVGICLVKVFQAEFLFKFNILNIYLCESKASVFSNK